MNVFTRWLCRTCWGWRFYLAGLTTWSIIEAVLLLTEDRWDFVNTSRSVGNVGIALTLTYMAIVVLVMVLTRPKTTLDRRWIWHQISVGVLFAYALGLGTHPQWYGQPRPGLPPEGTHPSGRLMIAAAIWFQLWGFVMWSALAVLVSTWNERGRFVWNRYGRFTRSLRGLSREQAETP